MKTLFALVAAGVSLASPSGASAEDAIVGVAREVMATRQDAVVQVSAVVKLTGGFAGMMGPQSDRKVETLGTIIHPSGLTVVSYTNLDPTSLFGSLDLGEDMGSMDFKAEFADVKVRLADGTEAPAKLVLKDADLDLAFILPDADSPEAKKVGAFPHIALSAGPEPKPLDEVILLWRLGSAMDHQLAVGIDRVAAVVHKPRTYYQAGGQLGAPVFNADGKILGISVMRKREGISIDMLMMGMGDAPFQPVVLPAADVQQVAEQALARPEEGGDRK